MASTDKLNLKPVDIGYRDHYTGGYNFRDVDCQGISIPLEVNAIMGKRASKFEVGLGFVTYLVDRQQDFNRREYFYDEKEDFTWASDISSRKNGFRPNIAGSINIGYRLQRQSGFFHEAWSLRALWQPELQSLRWSVRPPQHLPRLHNSPFLRLPILHISISYLLQIYNKSETHVNFFTIIIRFNFSKRKLKFRNLGRGLPPGWRRCFR